MELMLSIPVGDQPHFCRDVNASPAIQYTKCLFRNENE